MLSAVRIKQISILYEDVVHISMLSLVRIGSLHQGIMAGRLVHIFMSFVGDNFEFRQIHKG